MDRKDYVTQNSLEKKLREDQERIKQEDDDLDKDLLDLSSAGSKSSKRRNLTPNANDQFSQKISNEDNSTKQRSISNRPPVSPRPDSRKNKTNTIKETGKTTENISKDGDRLGDNLGDNNGDKASKGEQSGKSKRSWFSRKSADKQMTPRGDTSKTDKKKSKYDVEDEDDNNLSP